MKESLPPFRHALQKVKEPFALGPPIYGQRQVEETQSVVLALEPPHALHTNLEAAPDHLFRPIVGHARHQGRLLTQFQQQLPIAIQLSVGRTLSLANTVA